MAPRLIHIDHRCGACRDHGCGRGARPAVGPFGPNGPHRS